jgi:hypothetical protein
MDLTRAASLFSRVQETVDGRESWQVTDGEVRELHEVLRELVRLLEFTAAQALGELDFRGLTYGNGFSTPDSWFCATQRVDVGTARAELRLARSLVSGELPTVAEAWAGGHLDRDRAVTVAGIVEKLQKKGVEEQHCVTAEALLAEHGSGLAPTALAKVGREICDRFVVEEDPADDDPENRTLTIAETGVGKTFAVVNGTLDQVGAETVDTALDVFGPQRCNHPSMTESQRRGQALVSMAEFALANLTDAGPGAPARQVLVTVPWAVLTGAAGSGHLDRSGPVSGSTARQLACDAGISGVVTGQPGDVLDVGREQRFVTDRLRQALVVRDRGCVWPGCHRPSAQAEAHHLVPWQHGGGTSLENLALFCSSHHHRVHAEEGWESGLLDGIPFVRNARRGDGKQFHARFLAHRVPLAA